MPCRLLVERMGYVYLIRNGDLYKIGRTDNLQRRLKQLQPCTVIQTLETDRSRDLEYDLHKKFKSQRLPQTEYFRLSKSQVEEAAVALGRKPGPGTTSSITGLSGPNPWVGVPKEEYKSRGWDGPEWRDPDFRKEMEHRYWAGQDSGQPVSKEFMNFYKKVSQFVGRLWDLISLNKLKKLIKRAQSLIGRG